MMLGPEMEVMPSISDEKKTPDVEDEKIAEAESLAQEALRLAQEARRAAERLREVKASIRVLAKDKPKTQLNIDAEGKKDESDSFVVVDRIPMSPPSVLSPAHSIASPVSILKSSAGEKREPKGVRYAPDTVDKEQAKKDALAAAAARLENDPIVKLYDAVGIDRLCGLNFDEVVAESNQKKPGLSRAELAALIDTKLTASASEDSSDSRPQKVITSTNLRHALRAQQNLVFGADPFAAESFDFAESVDQSETELEAESSDAKEEADESTSEDEIEPDSTEETDEETIDADVGKTAEISPKAEDAVSEVSLPFDEETTSVSPVDESESTLPLDVAAPTRTKSVDPPPSEVAGVEPLIVSAAREAETPCTRETTKDIPALQAVNTPVENKQKDIGFSKSLSPYQKHLLSKRYNNLGVKADPFSDVENEYFF